MLKIKKEVNIQEWGFDNYGFRHTCGNNAIHINSKRVITYGTYLNINMYKVNKKDIRDLIDAGLVEKV
ncbi:hypothetical protein [PinkBerry-associated phage LS06-2018-MD08]|nr:hypothetical protein [PinkBerry-associated phage LS06-2018-MD08]